MVKFSETSAGNVGSYSYKSETSAGNVGSYSYKLEVVDIHDDDYTRRRAKISLSIPAKESLVNVLTANLEIGHSKYHPIHIKDGAVKLNVSVVHNEATIGILKEIVNHVQFMALRDSGEECDMPDTGPVVQEYYLVMLLEALFTLMD